MQVGTPSAKDQDRVLQGCESTGQLSSAELRLSGPYVPAPWGEEPFWRIVCQFLACGQCKGNKDDASGFASLDVAASQRSCSRRPREVASTGCSHFTRSPRARSLRCGN